MSKNVAMFVDVANMYYAARGQDVDVDYVALLKHATKGRDLIRAYAYTGLDPENENQRKFIDFLAKNGYKPVVKDIRKFGDGRMKANLDIELVVDLFRLADRMDIAVIVSGDGDFAPAIRALQDKGVRAEVISFKPNTSSDLIAVADEFTDIMKIASISRKEGRAARDSMSAPEMPAKEVTPEFGFREASASVAAAAIAALKGGGTDGGRRGTRGGSRRVAASAASPADEPEGERIVADVSEPADADTDGRRRRRRRGGRGRGRGRREGAEATAAATDSTLDEAELVGTADEEIGWEEFDDLSELDGGAPEEREYGFEEADAATLAELGLSPDEAGVAADAEPTDGGGSEDAEGARPPRRRASRAKKADAAEAEAPTPRRRASRAKKADAEEAEAAPRRRRSTRTTAEDGGEDAAATPKRRRSTRAAGDASAAEPTTAEPATTAESSTADASAEAEPQGIWGRFRTARRPRATGG